MTAKLGSAWEAGGAVWPVWRHVALSSWPREEPSQLTRDGIGFTERLLLTPNDEANARYFVPLPAKDEELARAMADASYSACVDRFAADITQAEADRVYEQCLADARRMLCEPEYNDLFMLWRPVN